MDFFYSSLTTLPCISLFIYALQDNTKSITTIFSYQARLILIMNAVWQEEKDSMQAFIGEEDRSTSLL